MVELDHENFGWTLGNENIGSKTRGGRETPGYEAIARVVHRETSCLVVTRTTPLPDPLNSSAGAVFGHENVIVSSTRHVEATEICGPLKPPGDEDIS
jgi:hypothetical protein